MERKTKMSPIKMQVYFQILVKFQRSSKKFFSTPSKATNFKQTNLLLAKTLF